MAKNHSTGSGTTSASTPGMTTPTTEKGREAKDAAETMAHETKHHARSAVHSVRATAEDSARRLRETARSAGEQAKERATEAGQKFKSQGQAFLTEQKDKAADEVSHLSTAVRCAADRLHESEDSNIASYVESVADQIDRASSYLRDRDLEGLMHDTQQFARRRPELVVGGMFLAGLAIARFLKASSEMSNDSYSYGYDESDLEREAALDASASSVGSRLPATPTGSSRAFQEGGFSTVTSANPTGATPSTSPGSAPSSTYNPGTTGAAGRSTSAGTSTRSPGGGTSINP